MLPARVDKLRVAIGMQDVHSMCAAADRDFLFSFAVAINAPSVDAGDVSGIIKEWKGDTAAQQLRGRFSCKARFL